MDYNETWLRVALAAPLLLLSEVCPTVAQEAAPEASIELDVVYPPGRYEEPIWLVGSIRAGLMAGEYSFASSANPAIVVADGAHLSIPPDVSISIDTIAGIAILADPTPDWDERTGQAPTVLVRGTGEATCVASIQGQILVIDGGMLEVRDITLVRPHKVMAPTGGDIVVKNGSTMRIMRATTRPEGTTGDHDTMAWDSTLVFESAHYLKGSVHPNDSYLVASLSQLAGGLNLGGSTSLDLTDCFVDQIGLVIGDDRWGFAQSGEVREDGRAWHYQWTELNLLEGAESARDKDSPLKLSYAIERTDIGAWVFDVSDVSSVGTHLDLNGFRGVPFGLGLNLRFERTGAAGGIDLGRLPTGPIPDSSMEDERYDALRRLASSAGIDLLLKDCDLSGWTVYVSGKANLAMACEEGGLFYETETGGDGRLFLYDSTVLASYLSAEDNSHFTLERCEVPYQEYAIRCVGSELGAPFLEFLDCRFLGVVPTLEPAGGSAAPVVLPRRQIVAANGGVMNLEGCRGLETLDLRCVEGGEIWVDGRRFCGD
ncbi:MAG: hypothetical protein HY720_05590 [Planctomycetes bacterium]|nr:hypothetical protein [Planctomycetota bacterium]